MSKARANRNNRPSVYDFHSCREFIQTLMEHYRKEKSDLSLLAIANQSDFSIAYLSAALRGKRRLTRDLFEVFLSKLDLENKERKYLELLWIFENSEDQKERMAALEKAHKILAKRKEVNEDITSSQFLMNWYVPTIYAMASLKEFKLDPKWIQSQLRQTVSLPDIKNAIRFLIQNDYLDPVEQSKRVKKPGNIFWKDSGVHQIALCEYYSQMLGVVEKSMYQDDRTDRKLVGYMVAAGRKKFEKMKAIIDQALKDAVDAPDEDGDEKIVYFTHFGATPLLVERGEQDG